MEILERQLNSNQSFLQDMVDFLLDNKSVKGYLSILMSLGIDEKRLDKLHYQNWEHTSMRFFRFFCPENFRNAVNHSGLPIPVFVLTKNTVTNHYEYIWKTELEIRLKSLSNILDQVRASIGDVLSIVGIGRNDIELITINNVSNGLIDVYYEIGQDIGFGSAMYPLRKLITSHQKKRKKK